MAEYIILIAVNWDVVYEAASNPCLLRYYDPAPKSAFKWLVATVKEICFLKKNQKGKSYTSSVDWILKVQPNDFYQNL